MPINLEEDFYTLAQLGARPGDTVQSKFRQPRILPEGFENWKSGKSPIWTMIKRARDVSPVVTMSTIQGEEWHLLREMTGQLIPGNLGASAQKPSKYQRIIRGIKLDIYDLLVAWRVTCPATQHAIKKLMMPGERGAKDRLTDLQEARDSINRAIELEKEKRA